MTTNVVIMDAQMKLIIAHLASIGFKCGCCGGTDFDHQSILQEIRNFSGIDGTLDNVRSPIFTLVCKKCACIIPLSATYLGLVPSNNPEFKPIL